MPKRPWQPENPHSESILFCKFGDFKNLTTLPGAGSGGFLYKGEHEAIGQVVVKQFPLTNLGKYKHEIEILIKHARHPNIVQLFGILENNFDNTSYGGYVMEYVEGGSLHDVIHQRVSHYDMPQISSWVKQICRGLQCLHRQQIIHKDIKPQNILLAGDKVKLADFGISRIADTSMTAGNGTYRYMAPEVIISRNYGPAADIYSLAITIWEIFHRKIPYCELGDVTEYALLSEIDKNGTRPTIDPHKIDEDAAELIKRCWQRSSSERPSIREIIEHFGSECNSLTPYNCLQDTEPFSKKSKGKIMFESEQLDDGNALSQGEYRRWVGCYPYGRISETHTLLVLGAGWGDEDMIVLDRTSNEWKWLVGAISTGHEGAVSLNDATYILYRGGSLKKIDKLNQWMDLATMNVKRHCCRNSIVKCNGSIWVLGGIGDEDGTSLTSVERYDLEENKWIEMTNMKYGRYNAAAASYHRKIVICGGTNKARELLDSVECFDTESGVWSELSRMIEPLCSHSLVFYKDMLILMGGMGGDNSVSQPYVYSLYLPEDLGHWFVLPPMKYRRHHFGAIVFGNDIYAIGGHGQYIEHLTQVEIFDGTSWRNGPILPFDNSAHSTVLIVPKYLYRTLEGERF